MNNRIQKTSKSDRHMSFGFHILLPMMLVALIGMAASIPSSAESVASPEEQAVEAKDTATSVVAEAFELIPDRDLDILTPSMRSDMIIYMQQTDSAYHIRNIYAGQSWIERMTEDYLRVHLTDVSDIQIKELPYSKKGQKLVMTIYTVAGEADTADSTIKFYTLGPNRNDSTVLTEVPAKKFFDLPNPKDFYDIKAGDESTTGRHLSMDDIMEEMPFHTVAYTIEPGKNVLTGHLTMSNYLTLEARRKIEPYLRPELQWAWDGKKWRKCATK